MNTMTLISSILFKHYRESGNPSSLDESVDEMEEVIAMAGPNHPEGPHQRQLYGEILLARYEAKHNAQDLDLAIECNERATDMISENEALAPTIDGSLASCLRRRYERTGNIEDLNLAIEKVSNAVDSRTISTSYHGQMTANLATFLTLRYHYLGALEDLNRALHAQETVIESVRQSDSDLIICLMKLSNTYSNRFIRLRSQQDIDEAAKLIRRAIDLRPTSDLQRIRCWVALARCLLQRSLLDTNPHHESDLDEGIAYLDKYAEQIPAKDPGRLEADMDLGRGLWSRFLRRQTLLDINRSVDILLNASTRVDFDNTLRADIFFQLGLALETRRKHVEDSRQKDRDGAVAAFSECFKSSSGIRIIRVLAADLGSNILESVGQWKEALYLLQVEFRAEPPLWL
ncbi:hypothetical protein Daus18300_009043 [Diaporthe australafricana]|uniref:TPR-like protein n=1 Tax=Diaporthe australafricana TaxID=127596 RepID=A0ABR3WG06_9PEZI